MAAGDARQLLVKFRADLRALKDDFSGVERAVKDLNKSLKADKDKAKSDAKAAVRQALNDEKVKQAAQRTTYEQQRAAAQRQLADQRAAMMQAAEARRKETAEIQKQIALLRLKNAQERGPRPGAVPERREGGGFLNMMGAGILKDLPSLMGGGIMGSVAGGMILGGGLVAGAEAAAHAISSLAEEMKNFIMTSGPLVQVEQQFQKLTKGMGVNADEFFEHLDEAAHHLVNEMQLYKTANAFMQSGLKVSTDQVTELTRATVDLARANGKDATLALQALQRSFLTGRFQMLAFVTGIQRAQLQVRGLGGAIDSTTRSQMQFDQVFAAITKRATEMGSPTITLTERLKQLKVVQENLMFAFMKGFGESGGLKVFVNSLGKMVEIMSSAKGAVEGLGNAFGDIIGTMSHFVTGIGESVATVMPKLDTLEKKIKDLMGIGADTTPGGGKKDSWLNQITSFHGWMVMINDDIDRMVINAKRLKEGFDYAFDRGKYKGMGKEEAKSTFQYELDIMDDELQRRLKKNKEGPGKNALGAGVTPTTPPDQNFLQQQRIKAAELDIKIKSEAEKAKLAAALDRINAEREADKEALQEGAVDLGTYIEMAKKLNKEEYDNKVAQIREEFNEQKSLHDIMLKEGRETAAIHAKEVQMLQNRMKRETATASSHLDQQNRNVDRQAFQDQLAQRRAMIEDNAAFEKQMLKNKEEDMKAAYAHGEIDVEAYIQSQKDAAKEELGIALNAAEEKYKISAKGNKDVEALQKAGTMAFLEYQRKLTSIENSETDERIKAIDKEYSRRSSYAQAKGTAQTLMGTDTTANIRANMQEQIDAIKSEIQGYWAEMNKLSDAGKKYSDEWTDIYAKQVAASQKLKEMQDTLSKMTSGSTGFGNLMQSLDKAFNFRGGSALRGLGAAGGFLGQLQTLNAGATTTFSKSGEVQRNIFASMGDTFKKLFTSSDKLSDKFKDFGKTLDPVVNAVGGFGQIMSGGGAVGGAMAGAGMGKDIGGMFKGLGNMGGPIGMAAGAAFGGVLSGIIGAKMDQAAKWIKQMQIQFQDVQQAVQMGTIGLAEGIKEAKEIRDQVQSQMNSSKKKSKAMYQSAIESMNASIKQMQDQQYTQMRDLYKQVDILSAGSPAMGDLLNNLDQIIQKYTQFAGAARNAQDLAQANNYLVLSLKNFAATQMNDLNSAEETAIQDAIKLNDLYVQRQQLLTQDAQQEYDIMTQGIITRQRSTAQSKMAQIELMKQQEAIQLQNMNQEISITQYKVNSEKQIFTLASTRIGLEAQLLAAQEVQTNYDMQRIIALNSLVAKIASPDFQGALTKGLNFNIGDPGTQAFLNLLAALGLPDVSKFFGNSGLSGSLLNQTSVYGGYGYSGYSPVGAGG